MVVAFKNVRSKVLAAFQNDVSSDFVVEGTSLRKAARASKARIVVLFVPGSEPQDVRPGFLKKGDSSELT